MDYRLSRNRNGHKDHPGQRKIYKEHRAKTPIENEILPSLFKNYFNNFKIIGTIEKSLEKKAFLHNESFKILRAMSLALSVLILCYYGSTKYNILQNGQISRGFPLRKTIVTFSFGYSTSHTIIFVIAAGMLIYSIIMKRPQFSLPFIGFFLAGLVCDFCDMIIVIWYLFKHLRMQIAFLYAAGFILLILTEMWMWLAVVKLYECRSLKQSVINAKTRN
ncbi:hypothetical protein PUN28_007559 [Cardiocondyla obscurior]|uniref:Uncharacterized protein n=1 Tax=Cardiocondyla obscurior TaxID=286306 RepID=A0AAW2G3X1_9HYME